MHHWRQGAHSRFIELNAPKANTNKLVLIQSPFRVLEILPSPAYGFIIKHKDVKKVDFIPSQVPLRHFLFNSALAQGGKSSHSILTDLNAADSPLLNLSGCLFSGKPSIEMLAKKWVSCNVSLTEDTCDYLGTRRSDSNSMPVLSKGPKIKLPHNIFYISLCLYQPFKKYIPL